MTICQEMTKHRPDESTVSTHSRIEGKIWPTTTYKFTVKYFEMQSCKHTKTSYQIKLMLISYTHRKNTLLEKCCFHCAVNQKASHLLHSWMQAKITDDDVSVRVSSCSFHGFASFSTLLNLVTFSLNSWAFAAAPSSGLAETTERICYRTRTCTNRKREDWRRNNMQQVITDRADISTGDCDATLPSYSRLHTKADQRRNLHHKTARKIPETSDSVELLRRTQLDGCS